MRNTHEADTERSRKIREASAAIEKEDTRRIKSSIDVSIASFLQELRPLEFPSVNFRESPLLKCHSDS